MGDELTYEQMYEIPVTVVLREFSVEYEGCGTHQLLINGVTTLEDLQRLFDAIKMTPGLTP